MPETWRPRCFSSEGVQATSWKPRPSSIIAKRPDESVKQLAIGAGDILITAGAPERLPGLRCEFLAQGFHFALAERAEQIAAEDDPWTLPFTRPSARTVPAPSARTKQGANSMTGFSTVIPLSTDRSQASVECEVFLQPAPSLHGRAEATGPGRLPTLYLSYRTAATARRPSSRACLVR